MEHEEAHPQIERGDPGTQSTDLPVFFLDLGEKRLGEAHEVAFGQLDLVAHLEPKHGLLRRELDRGAGRIWPAWELVDLKLALGEQERVAQHADLVQRIAILPVARAPDPGPTVDEHVSSHERAGPVLA